MRVIRVCILICLTTSGGWLLAPDQPEPLVRAHAHNDYYHKRPLLDALACGFCSVEADVFLKDGKLLVGHFSFELRKARTLEALYLQPLAERVKANKGVVYKTRAPFHLMIDLKTDCESTYAALKVLLKKYRFLLTQFTRDSTSLGAVTVIISGIIISFEICI